MVDGLFIRSLLCSFFIKIFPDIITEGKLFIAEPPLYRVDDKKDPFVINKEDYINRYITSVVKDYKIGYQLSTMELQFMDKKELKKFLSDTSSYVDDIQMLTQHYKVNGRLIEMIIEEFGVIDYPSNITVLELIKRINIQNMMSKIMREFNEVSYDDKDRLIKGIIDGEYQSLEISESLIRKALPLVEIIKKYGSSEGRSLLLKHVKTGSEYILSLLGILKILKKYQPNIQHRFKGLGENADEDIKFTILDPNTRTLIRVQSSDIENDMKTFQTLRGTSLTDELNRKMMMRSFQVMRDMIDT